MPLRPFLPAVRTWFEQALGAPTAPQRQGWPAIQAGASALIAAPTGSGKTLAAFLSALDGLLRQGPALPDAVQVVYVSPLRALSNDVQKNLKVPLEGIRALDPALPDVRVLVRHGDTPAGERTRMRRTPPHILVTTPESLYVLLTSAGGRDMLRTARTVIVDEIHATLGDKRGAHLALSLERLEALAGPLQRIGLSATQKPVEDVAHFLCGVGRECEVVDIGHQREMDLAVVVPESPLQAVCSHETWEEIYSRIGALIEAHRTTLIFVNTRKLAERVSARLQDLLGEDQVACHHSSLSKERRLDAEERLKCGRLRALVATASLELGIDIGDIDLVIQVGGTSSIATFLQRVGRAGHRLAETPKGRLVPLTIDELVETAALFRAVRARLLDRTPQPGKPLDILAQQIVAATVEEDWLEDDLFERLRRAWPYRDLDRAAFDSLLELHSQGRHALLHRDGVGGRVMATRRARLSALLNGGAIPDNANYRVLQEPEGTFIGTVDEDFAVESSVGDVFQLGNTSWQVLKVESGTMRVADVGAVPPSLPFWVGEGPSRTRELSAEVSTLRGRWQERERERESAGREWLRENTGLPDAATDQIHEYFQKARALLGELPTQDCLVIERFFDESGGTQMVVHTPYGGRINRAFGFALRKRFCRGFGFELQAAANEDAILLSLGPQHSFPLDEVFDYLHPRNVREVLIQAILPAPMFKTRWRWNVVRALMLERMRSGKKVPAPLLRMRAEDLMVQAFPDVMACPETLPGGDLEIPDHPIVQQTIHDCLTEAMDLDGLVELLTRLRAGEVRRVAVDTREPSPFCHSILSARPYAFLDDAPLEERRTQAVLTRRSLDPRSADGIGALDPEAIARVREEAWPQPTSLEEVHEALLWMGYVNAVEAEPWTGWLQELAAAGRVVREEGRWFAVEATRDPVEVLRGRMEALGPVHDDDPLLYELERRGHVLRTRIDGREAWCNRRLLARIQRYTIERLRQEIRPVSAGQFLRFLACWQHVDERHRLEGPAGVETVVTQLAGLEVPMGAWERAVLPARVKDYRREWLDRLTLTGELAWGRLWGAGRSAIRSTPISLFRREDLESWMSLAGPATTDGLSGPAQVVHELLQQRGALFPKELERSARLLPSHLDQAVGELIAHGVLTGDSFDALRQLLVPPSRRKRRVLGVGRWSLFRTGPTGAAHGDQLDRAPTSGVAASPDLEFVARQLLLRTGVVFRKVLERERIPVPWRDLIRVYRALELKGEVRGGRFVERFAGEQYAMPEAVSMLRRVRREEPRAPAQVAAADPLNFRGILTPDDRVSPLTHVTVEVG